VPRKAAWVRPGDDGLRAAAAAAGAHPQPSSSGQHRTMRQGGNVCHRLGDRRSNASFGPSHRDRGNRTLHEELAAIRRGTSKEESAANVE
jgi:hypothetical protein